MNDGPIRVLIADDEDEVRAALTDLIGGDEHMGVVGLAANTVDAVELAAATRPAVMLMDVRIPPDGGARASAMALERSPDTRIVAYSAFEDRTSVMEMLRAGAVAYVSKTATADEVLDAIHGAFEGTSSLSPEASSQLVSELASRLRREGQERERLAERTRTVEAALDGGVSMVYQPIVDLRTEAVLGMEALARFSTEPRRPPNEWFDEAWDIGKGAELELHAAALGAGSLNETAHPTFVSINLSPVAICDPGFQAVFQGIPFDRVVLEVTEHAAVEDYHRLADALREPREHGLRLAIDDAGAGYASLRHILRLAPDLIKIDIDLTRGIEADRRRRALARALISFAAEIGAEVVAEGVETEVEREALQELGVRWGQGYLLGRPAPLEHVLASNASLVPARPVPRVAILNGS